MTRVRLRAAGTAACLVLAALVLLAGALAHAAADRVHAVAPHLFAEKVGGMALQRAAFRQPDLLALYGASELTVPNPFHASAVFRDYPTGFTVFPVGTAGSGSLLWLQALAGVGSDLRGRKVAISFSPRAFILDPFDPNAYAGNFSLLHANELAFGTTLSGTLRQEVARRMLAYPATLDADPLLRFALQQLADGSPTSRLLYAAALPLGWAHLAALRLQDAWRTLGYLRALPEGPPPPRRAAAVDWAGLQARAARDTERRTGNNRFGFENGFWADHAAEIGLQRGAYAGGGAPRALDVDSQWGDMELLLRTVRELGGEALLLSLPINGPYADHLGMPASARQAYHQRLRALADAHGVPLVDFAAHDDDARFTADAGLHLSGRGWTAVARALDAFFHDRPTERM